MDDALPSVGMTIRFLAVCNRYGSRRVAVAIVADGRRQGLRELPDGNDWVTWNWAELGAAVDYLEKRLR